MSAYNVQINYVAMVTSCHTIFFFHFQNVELQTMVTVVLRVVPVVQLILPTVTTLTVIVHVIRDGMERFVTSILMNA
jgi:hypothetical protein